MNHSLSEGEMGSHRRDIEHIRTNVGRNYGNRARSPKSAGTSFMFDETQMNNDEV